MGVLTLVMICLLVAMEWIYPLLNRKLTIPVSDRNIPEPTREAEQPKEPETLLVTALYRREKNAKEITGIFIEVFHTGTGKAYYMEVPVHTKVSLSTELFKKLQAYAPELPQDFKLSKMGEGFSDEYCLTACNRILSEVLGVTVEHYVCADAASLEAWAKGVNGMVASGQSSEEFYAAYTEWLEHTEADFTVMERWVYYESYCKLTPAETEPAPGAEGLSEFLVSTKLAQNRLQEWMRLVEE